MATLSFSVYLLPVPCSLTFSLFFLLPSFPSSLHLSHSPSPSLPPSFPPSLSLYSFLPLFSPSLPPSVSSSRSQVASSLVWSWKRWAQVWISSSEELNLHPTASSRRHAESLWPRRSEFMSACLNEQIDYCMGLSVNGYW